MERELVFLDFIQRFRFEGLDRIMVCISRLGDQGSIWIFVALLLLAFKPKQEKWWGVHVILSLGISLLVVNGIIKPWVGRTRPFVSRPELSLLLRVPGDASFPSGHTSASFAAASALFLRDKRLGIPALVFAALMGVSRMYLYVHFPTDVLAGAVFGIVAGLLAESILRLLKVGPMN